MAIQVHTIGFAQRTAKDFFTTLSKEHPKRLLDVRRWPNSQMSGWARGKDLPWLLGELSLMSYRRLPLLAPAPELLRDYRNQLIEWDGRDGYAQRYLDQLARDQVGEKLTPSDLDGGCLLCSEHDADHCHRRLAAEYLRDCWSVKMEIIHL